MRSSALSFLGQCEGEGEFGRACLGEGRMAVAARPAILMARAHRGGEECGELRENRGRGRQQLGGD